MFSPFERRLIGRYLLPGAEGRIVILVATIGLTAVAIGVAALIIVMSAMNGARTKLSMQFAGINGHASISRAGGEIADWRRLRAMALRQPEVLAAAPALDIPAIATREGVALPASIRGMQPTDMRAQPMVAAGSFIGALPRGTDEAAIGFELAGRLGASLGTEITIMRAVPEPDGNLSVESAGLVVTGLFETGLPQHDASLVLMTLPAAQAMLRKGDVATRINLTARSPAQAEAVVPVLRAALGAGMLVQSWRELNKPIFDALALDQAGMFIALSLIVLVALFNISSSLVMLVRSKLRDIAIMRTMGASRTSILKVFMAIGTAIGSSGTLLGSAIGLGIVAGKEEIADFLKSYVLPASYRAELSLIIDLPAEIGWAQLAGIAGMVLAGSILATLHPALRAANVDPAAMLRHQ